MVLLSVFWMATVVQARTNLQSTYRLWTDSQVTVLPAGGGGTTSFAVVVDSNWARVPSEVCVNFLWQEVWPGELANFGQTQKVCSDQQGNVFFSSPPCSESFFRYLTMWVDGDLSSIAHRLFWYTADTTMPARINFISGSSCLSLGETGSYVFQVLNAWGTPLPGVRVQVISGECHTSPEVEVSDTSGYATFNFTAPSGAVGSEQMRVRLDPWHFLQAGLLVSWGGGTPTPPPTPTGEVSTIEVVNATTYDGSLPVFDLAIGQSYSAVFIAKDNSGNPVSGVSLTCTFPSATATTGSDGRATFPLMGGNSAGSDMGQIYVTSNSGVYLDFRIVTGSTPPPTGDVASISAVNPTSWEGSLPIWTANIGQTVSATFVAKNSSGQIVSGVSLSVLYPSVSVTTDSSGQITVTIPASQFSGWDGSQVWVTADPTVLLDFKIIYQ